MRTYTNFEAIFNDRRNLPEEGWIYIKKEDFEDLEDANYYVFEEDELTLSDYIETETDVVPTLLYNKFETITTLVECYMFKAIYDNMDEQNRNFDMKERIDALYYYLENDCFQY